MLTWASALLLCGAVFVCGRWLEVVVHDGWSAADTDGDGGASSDGLDEP